MGMSWSGGYLHYAMRIKSPIEEVYDFLLRPWTPEPSRALSGSA